jgi:hypothetical protein
MLALQAAGACDVLFTSSFSPELPPALPQGDGSDHAGHLQAVVIDLAGTGKTV